MGPVVTAGPFSKGNASNGNIHERVLCRPGLGSLVFSAQRSDLNLCIRKADLYVNGSMATDYHLKSIASLKFVEPTLTGRTAQKIRLLIFKIA
jgi:hypothetical protein